MKPRTKLQHEVIQLSKYYLRDQTYDLQWWARDACLEHKGFAIKTAVTCMDCGDSFSPELVKRKRAVCPYCNTTLKVEQTRKRTDKQRTYFAYAEICGDFQVVRYYELIADYKVGRNRNVHCYEILQHWILPNGKREVVAKNHTVNWYYDSWNGTMEIRNKNTKKHNYYSEDKYDIYTENFHPDSQFKPMYLKYGINKDLAGLSFIKALKIVPEEPKAETLLKAKQHRLLSLFTGSKRWHISYFWDSIKICMRNKYNPTDAGIWIDYLELLEYFGCDLRNAKYVCPKNLKAEHDRLVDKKRKKQEREAKIRHREEAIKRENAYREFIQRFLDLEFVDKEIQINPLKTIEEFEIEGKELKHCVFTNNYFKKEDSLILSAKLNGMRIETIQFNLKTLKVEQCRGLRNNNTEYHDRILRLVNRNKKQIKERLTA